MARKDHPNKGGRGNKADKQKRLQGVWSYYKHDDSVENRRAKDVMDFWKANENRYTQKDFIEEALLFWREAQATGYYRPAHLPITEELVRQVNRLQKAIAKIENLRAVIPSEHHATFDAITEEIAGVRGATDVMVGATFEFDIEDED